MGSREEVLAMFFLAQAQEFLRRGEVSIAQILLGLSGAVAGGDEDSLLQPVKAWVKTKLEQIYSEEAHHVDEAGEERPIQ